MSDQPLTFEFEDAGTYSAFVTETKAQVLVHVAMRMASFALGRKVSYDRADDDTNRLDATWTEDGVDRRVVIGRIRT